MMKSINQNLSRSEIPYFTKPRTWLWFPCKQPGSALSPAVPGSGAGELCPSSHTVTTSPPGTGRAVLCSRPSTELREQRNTGNPSPRRTTSMEKVRALAPQLFSGPAQPSPSHPAATREPGHWQQHPTPVPGAGPGSGP